MVAGLGVQQLHPALPPSAKEASSKLGEGLGQARLSPEGRGGCWARLPSRQAGRPTVLSSLGSEWLQPRGPFRLTLVLWPVGLLALIDSFPVQHWPLYLPCWSVGPKWKWQPQAATCRLPSWWQV